MSRKIVIAIVVGLLAIGYSAWRVSSIDLSEPSRELVPDTIEAPVPKSASKNPAWIMDLPKAQQQWIAEHVPFGVPAHDDEECVTYLVTRLTSSSTPIG